MLDFPRDFPRRGEIYFAPLDKDRPVLIISENTGNKFSEQVVVAAITSTIKDKEYPVDVRLDAGDPLPHAGKVLCRSLYTLFKSDLRIHKGELRPEQLAEVDAALIAALQLPKGPT